MGLEIWICNMGGYLLQLLLLASRFFGAVFFTGMVMGQGDMGVVALWLLASSSLASACCCFAPCFFCK